MPTQTELKKVRLSVSNAVHSLTVLVAHEEGLFREQGLDVEILKTPGSANVNTPIRPEKIFDRPLEILYNSGGMDQFRLCEWGVMKRAVDGEGSDQRPAKIVALGAAMSKFAIVTSPDSSIVEPEQLANTEIAVTVFNGSHFTTLKMLEGFLRKDEIKVISQERCRSGWKPYGGANWRPVPSTSPGSAWRRNKGSASSWRVTPPVARLLATRWMDRLWQQILKPKPRPRR
mgnify:CR=1 FL=1